MRVGVGVPAKATAGSGISHLISSMTMETWFTTQPDGRLTERLVRSWHWDPSGTTLRLELRDNVRFHDGTLLTPDIAAQSIREAAAAKNTYPSLTTIRSVRPAGDHALELQLTEPNSFLLPDLSLVSPELPGRPDVGTGPFQLVSPKTESDEEPLVFRAFPQYYRGRPALDEIVLSNHKTQRNAWTALMRGDIDMLYEISREAIDFVSAETTVETYHSPRPYSIMLGFNVRHPMLKPAAVRRALNEALDKPTLVREALRGRGRPSDGPLIPEHWAYSAPPQPFVYSPSSASARLDAAGFKLRPASRGRMPSRIAFTCLIYAEDARFERMAVLVQKQLAAVGVDMSLEPVSLRGIVGRVAKGDFDAFMLETAGRSLNWVDKFWHSRGGQINNGYHALDAVLDRVRLARSDDAIKSGVAELMRIVHDDPPAAFLAWQETNRAVSRKFDVGAEEGRDIVTNVWKWRVAERRVP
jgi:peptide/nickel transport system substrate-binding protein